jgi:predicted PurR-regulated permease PerM
MDKGIIKGSLLVVTYSFVLVVIVVKIDLVAELVFNGLRLLTPLFIGTALAFILNVPYSFFLRQFRRLLRGRFWRIFAKPLTIGTVYCLLFGVAAAFISVIIPQLRASIVLFSDNLGSYASTITELAYDISALFGLNAVETEAAINQIILDLPEISKNLVTGVSPYVIDFTMHVLLMVFYIGVGIILSVYFLVDKDRIIRQFARLIKAYVKPAQAEKIFHIGRLANCIYSQFIGGRLIDMALVGIICYISMGIFGMPYALLISVIIAVTNIIPVFGPFVGAVFPTFILFMVDPMQAFWFVIFIIVLQQFDGNILYPLVAGNTIGLPAQWVLLAVMVGGGLFGLVGMLLAVPTVSLIYQLLREGVRERLDGPRLEEVDNNELNECD